MSWPVLLGALLLAAPASPPEPECEPVLGGKLRPGRWGVVRLVVTNSSGAACRVRLGQICPVDPEAWQVTLDPVALAAWQRGEHVLPLRPLAAEFPLVAKVGDNGVKFPDRVAPAGPPAVVVVGPPGAPPPPLPAENPGYVSAGALPRYLAVYESADVLVFGPASGLETLDFEQEGALAGWFRAGGRVVVDSPEAMVSVAGLLLGRSEKQVPTDRAGWLELLGASEKDVRLWDGERPAVALFRYGFGRGLYADLSRASAVPAWAQAAKAAYRELLEGRPGSCAPLTWPGLYNEPGRGDFPGLDRAMIGAGAALRWALGAALLIAAVGAVAWRRSRPWRLALAASAAGLLAALGIAFAVHPVQYRTLSLQVAECAPDKKATRVREYLFIEKAGSPEPLAVNCGPGVLPGPILFDAAEASGMSWELLVPPAGPGAPAGAVLSDLKFREKSLWLGAGQPQVEPQAVIPFGASHRRELEELAGPEAVRAVADCLADRRSRCREQAEFLARWLVREALARDGGGPVTVCRMPEADAEAAMRVKGSGVRGERLHALGIFYGVWQ